MARPSSRPRSSLTASDPMRLSPALLALLLVAAPLRAQEQTAVFTALPVLEIPAVPELGGATVGRQTDDARAFLQNPAALALAPVGQAVAGSPSAVWFGESRFETAAASWTARRGRLALGIGLATGALSGDARTLGDGTPFDPTDRFRALGVSVGTVGAVRASVGVTARLVTSTDAPVFDGARYTVGRLVGGTADVGALVSADVARLAGNPRIGPLAPALDLSAGYAQTHLGGMVRYSGFGSQSLPRTGALGWSARAGLDLHVGTTTLRLIEAEGAFQGERRLVRESNDVTSYAALTDGFRISDALTGSGDDVTTGRNGVRLGLAETLSLSWGRFDGGGYRSIATRGVEVRTAGLFTLAAQHIAPGRLADALARTDLRVGRSTVFAGTDSASARTTVSLVIR